MSPSTLLSSGYSLVALDEVDSTNEEAKRRAKNGAGEGALIWARRQAAGRGRRGRAWISEPGNLFTSLILRPDCSPAKAAELTFVAANAVLDVVAECVLPDQQVEAKWPNDVLIEGRKVAGILLESSTAPSGKLDWLVVGIGINVLHQPEGTEFPATSLRASGSTATVEMTLESLARYFAYGKALWEEQGFDAVREAWLRRASGLGQPIRVRLSQESIEGTFAGLDASGALILDTGAQRRRITAGDVFPAAA
jgi:BirA family biotin operon repressor/biotin-[acetyl-CoA-carboxylase] ligase